MNKITPIRILVVEDEATIALDLRISLEELGYNVVGLAKNFDRALTLFKEESPDLVLLDINLKNSKSGVEIAKVLQKDSDVPYVFLTAFSDRNTFEQAKEVKPMAFLNKPFDTNTLRNTIEVAIESYKRMDVDSKDYILLLDQLDSAAILCDEDLKIRGINKSMERLSGYLDSDIKEVDLEKYLKFSHRDKDKYEGTLIHRNQDEISLTISKISIKNGNESVSNHIYVIDEMNGSKSNSTVVINEKPKIGDSLFVKHKGDYHRVLLENILQVSALDNYVIVNTKEKKYVVHSFLSEFEKLLPKDEFLRVHRSHIINLLKVEKLNEIGVLIDGQIVPVSKANKKKLLGRLKVV